MDFSFLPSEEIQDMINSGQVELARRQTQAAFTDELAALQSKYRAALGIEPIEFWPWEEPEYALDAPGRGDTVDYDGNLYRSLLPCNLLTPGGTGFRKVTRNGAPLSWVEPEREHDAYAKGERAIRIGVTYESLNDENTAMPSPDSDSWQAVSESDEE